ncbi:hypothetical protein [uncultured Brevundimonas sp.]|uniref:hypothetical protein n=1 Tax=uncultured Brevundimonas sp. TaxID=213418 RepID=UPI0030EB1750|tara:strand:- start:3970 stop:4461 length:492 start_codon:yes stop_codon:yes gene_type:complete
MRGSVFLLPLAAVLAIATTAQAQPAEVRVTIGAELQEKAGDLGERDVQRQAEALVTVVSRALTRAGALEGSRVELVLTDLKPNRPTYEQLTQRPGLDALRSFSAGGATIEGEVVTADGQHLPVRYDWYTSNITEVHGFGTWQDADRAFDRLAANLVAGRLVTR